MEKITVESEKKRMSDAIDANEKLKDKRQKTEVYSRIVGYIRPVDQWNPGKQSEWEDRKEFNVSESAKMGTSSDWDKQVPSSTTAIRQKNN
jgi:predicted secreted protein